MFGGPDIGFILTPGIVSENGTRKKGVFEMDGAHIYFACPYCGAINKTSSAYYPAHADSLVCKGKNCFRHLYCFYVEKVDDTSKLHY